MPPHVHMMAGIDRPAMIPAVHDTRGCTTTSWYSATRRRCADLAMNTSPGAIDSPAPRWCGLHQWSQHAENS